MPKGTKSNSKIVALNVLLKPNAWSKSGSPPQPIPPPPSEIYAFGPGVSLILPVVSTIPFSKGNVVPVALKYPKLFSPEAKFPPEKLMLDTLAHGLLINTFSTKSCWVRF